MLQRRPVAVTFGPPEVPCVVKGERQRKGDEAGQESDGDVKVAHLAADQVL